MNQQLPPPGALPKEVADDQNIKASEGEYVIPADVVRFLGLDHIEKMIAKAKEGLQAMHQNGRIGGQTDGPAEEMAEGSADNPVEEAQEVQPNVPHMALGGLVQSLGTALTGDVASGSMGSTAGSDPNFTGIKQFKGPSGDIVYVPFSGGEAAMQIPEGYVEQGGAGTIKTPTTPTVAPKPIKQYDPDAPGSPGYRVSGIARDSGRVNETNMDGTMGGRPETWGAKAVSDYYANRNSRLANYGEKALKAAIPGSGLMMKMATNRINNVVPERIDSMLASGKDIDGTALNEKQIADLKAAKAQMEARTASTAPQGVFAGIKNAINSVVAKATGKDTTTSPTVSGGDLKEARGKGEKDGGTKDRGSMNKGATGANSQSVSKGKNDKGSGTKFAGGGLVTRTAPKKKTPATIGGIMTKT